MKKVTEYAEQLRQVDKFIRLYHELEINIETISYMPDRIRNMHDEITALRNRLRL